MISERVERFAAVGVLLLGLVGASPKVSAGGLTFQTIDNPADPTFNQLLGINNSGTIAGYYGDGVNNPNKGYTLAPPYGPGNYTGENYPGSVQTQVVGINNSGQTVGFWADSNGDNFGFVKSGGTFVPVVDPNTPGGGPGGAVMNQLLGINDNNQAAGFYVDANGDTHGYVYNVLSGTFTAINVAGATNVTATGINNSGLVSGFFTNAAGFTEGFVENVNGTGLETFEAPGSTNTTFLGLNNVGQVVGSYVDAAGNTDGLLFNLATQTMTTIDDPGGLNGTTLNGINDLGQIVGFYVDAANENHGLLITSAVPEPASIGLMLIGFTAVLAYGYSRRGKRTDGVLDPGALQILA